MVSSKLSRKAPARLASFSHPLRYWTNVAEDLWAACELIEGKRCFVERLESVVNPIAIEIGEVLYLFCSAEDWMFDAPPVLKRHGSRSAKSAVPSSQPLDLAGPRCGPKSSKRANESLFVLRQPHVHLSE